jgi:hypothetical protein
MRPTDSNVRRREFLTQAAVGLAGKSKRLLGLATANYRAIIHTSFPPGTIGRMRSVQNCAASVAGILSYLMVREKYALDLTA